MAFIYHPETQASVAVPDESVTHYRLSGWVTVDEWQEHQRLRALTEEAARAVREHTGAEPEPAGMESADAEPVRQPRKTAADKETK